jgi:hypothetical protein
MERIDLQASVGYQVLKIKKLVDGYKPSFFYYWELPLTLHRGCEVVAGPGRAKTFLQGRRKTIPGRIISCFCCDGEETSWSENGTCLKAARLPKQLAAGVAAAHGPGSLL